MILSNIEVAHRLAIRLYPELSGETPIIPKQGAQAYALIYPDRVIKISYNTWNNISLRIEANVLEQLKNMDLGEVSIPQLIDYDASNNVLVMSRLAGRPLDKYTMTNMSAEQRCRLGARLGKFLATIHGFVLELEDKRNTRSQQDILSALSALHDTKIQERANICDDDIEQIKKYLEYLPIHDEPLCCLHGDISLGNLLYCAETEQLSVIDFAGSYRGWRYEEFLRVGNFHPDIHVACLNTYNTISPIKVSEEMINASRKAESVMRVLNLNSGLQMKFEP